MLVSFSCRGFRNLEATRWSPGGENHLILGDNGAGKTSLLEAIYLLATSRSFRTAQVAECVAAGGSEFRLEGEVEGQTRVRLEASWSQGHRSRSANGRIVPLRRYLAALPVVSWTAATAEMLVGPPAGRRRYIDQGLVAWRPAAIDSLGRYRRALEQKRRLLERADPSLGSWNRVLATEIAEIARLRGEYAERLQGELDGLLAESDLGIPPLALRYRPSPREALSGVEAIGRLLERVTPRERRLGRPLVGSHRDRLEILWNGREVKEGVSAGERKLLGLALTAARGRLLARDRRSPIHLLDDADSELDRGRLRAAIRLFSGARQVLATSSRPAAWEGLFPGRRWSLQTGRLEAS